MARRVRRSLTFSEWPETDMTNVARAADRAMEEVLEEDRALREWGVQPPNGRSQ